MTAELESNFKLTKHTPYLALIGELSGVCCEDYEENLLHYNGTVYVYPEEHVSSLKKIQF